MTPCCEGLAAAIAEGSDCEGNHALIWHGSGENFYGLHEHERGNWNVGCGLPPISFCPWCATRLTAPEGTMTKDKQIIALQEQNKMYRQLLNECHNAMTDYIQTIERANPMAALNYGHNLLNAISGALSPVRQVPTQAQPK